MNKHVHIPKKTRKNPSAFGGYIYLSDFNTSSKGRKNQPYSSVAQRILSDRRFDEQCRKYTENGGDDIAR